MGKANSSSWYRIFTVWWIDILWFFFFILPLCNAQKFTSINPGFHCQSCAGRKQYNEVVESSVDCGWANFDIFVRKFGLICGIVLKWVKWFINSVYSSKLRSKDVQIENLIISLLRIESEIWQNQFAWSVHSAESYAESWIWKNIFIDELSCKIAY